MKIERKVLTSKGEVYILPIKNSVLKEGETIIATDSDGGLLLTSADDDFIWDTIENHMDGSLEGFSPIKVNTFQKQLDYYKSVIADALNKVEFLEKL